MISAAPTEIVPALYCLMLSISIALISSPAAARLLSEEVLVYSREFKSGHSPFAYFMGKNIIAVYRIALLSLHYASLVQIMTRPTATFQFTYIIVFGWYFGVWGIGQVVSLLSKPANAPLTSLLAALGFSVFTGIGPRLSDHNSGWISIGYSRWLGEALYATEVRPFDKIYRTEFSASIFGYNLDNFPVDIGKISNIMHLFSHDFM